VNNRCVPFDDQIFSHSLKTLNKSCLALPAYLDVFSHSNDTNIQVEPSSDKNHEYKLRYLFPNILYIVYGFIILLNLHYFIVFAFEEIMTFVKDIYPVEFKVHKLRDNLSYNFECMS
jgi:hypothetical protein